MSSRQVTKLSASRRESHCRYCRSESKLIRERVARQVMNLLARRAAPYFEPQNDKSLAELFRESLRVDLLRERVARQVFLESVALYVEPPNDKALGQSQGESLSILSLGK
jgi:hypothetical protein